MTYDSKDFSKLCQSYLRGDLQLISLPNSLTYWDYRLCVGEANRRKLLIKILVDKWPDLSSWEKIEWVREIKYSLEKVPISSEVGSEIDRAKRLLSDLINAAPIFKPNKDWQQSWLGINLAIHHDISYPEVTYNANAEEPLDVSNRFIEHQSQIKRYEKNSFALIGSTFLTNRPQILSNHQHNNNSTHVLDALYSAYVLDENDQPEGLVIAVADGCGGHFGEISQDKAIAQAAQIAARQAAYYCAVFNDHNQLKAKLSEIIEAIGEDIRRSLPANHQEGTTLSIARAFPIGDKFRIVGANLGDSMLCAWDGMKLVTLCPAEVAFMRQGQTATAILPTNYRPHEIRVFDITVPATAMLIALSDGMHDHLPCRMQLKVDNGAQYQLREIDSSAETLLKFANELGRDPGAFEVASIILQHIICLCESLRKQQVTQAANTRLELINLQKAIEKKREILLGNKKDLLNKLSIKTEDGSLNAANKKLQVELDNTEKELRHIYDPLHELEAQQTIQLGDDASLIVTQLPHVSRLFPPTQMNASKNSFQEAEINKATQNSSFLK